MKTVIQIVLWIGCIALGYFIYNSITGPIKFKEVKEERFAQVIAKLKDIRNSQEATKLLMASMQMISIVLFVLSIPVNM